MTGLVARGRGIARSLAMYYGRPGRSGPMDRLHARFVRPGGLCFDIGAHVGNRARSFRRLGARVVAVEPQPDFARVLRLLAAFDRRLTVLPVAVGAAPGSVTLRISSRHPTVTTASSDWIGQVQADRGFADVAWDRTLTVPATTLDHLIDRYGRPDFCKIDVEGLELDVLRGAGQMLPAVAFEYLPAAWDRAVACADWLAARGPYRFNLARSEDYTFLLPAPVDHAGLLDWFAAARGREADSGDVYAWLEPAPP